MTLIRLVDIGFAALMTPTNILLVLAGVVGGMAFSLLPGLSLVMIMVLLLPLTYGASVVHSMSLLLGAYVGGTYGGVITSILYNVPGDSIHVPMLWDGYNMTRRGLAKRAIGWTVVAFTVGGAAAALVMTFVSGPLAHVALSFSSPDYFAVIVFALTTAGALGTALGASGLATLLSLAIGLFLATVGTDPVYGTGRFTFGIHFLWGGIHFIPAMIGLFAVAEVLDRLHQGPQDLSQQKGVGRYVELPSWSDVRERWASFCRGTLVGTFIGSLPGAGATVASFVSYGIERNYGAKGEELGTGIPEGLVVTQSAATASVGGALIPLLTLGIPGSAADVVLLGALQLHDVYPNPTVVSSRPDVIFPMFACVFVAIVLTVIVTLVSMKGMVAILGTPSSVLSAVIMLLSLLGAYTVRGDIGDVWVAAGMGVLGYVLKRLRFPVAPLLLGVILGPLAESNLVTAMASHHRNWMIFFTDRVSLLFLVLAALSLLIPMVTRRVRSGTAMGQAES